MKKRYIVFIKLGYENINMAICNTKDIAIKCSQKINEYISSIDSISEKISNEEMMCIDGGFNPGVILPGVAAVWVCYEIGYAVGKAFVHATSR